MRKAAVRDGDSTTTGGRVIGSSTGYTDRGTRLALDGDVATCSNCKGTHRIFGTGKGIFDRGRKVVVDGDSVLCPCGKNRVIVGRNPGYFLNSDHGSARASNAATEIESASSSLATGTFDEQIRAAAPGVTLKDYPYFIKTTDGRTSYGRTDADGKPTATRAYELAEWLKLRPIAGLHAPENVTGADWQSKVKGRTGIIFFYGYWRQDGDSADQLSGGHIDLWNKDTLTPSAESFLRFRVGIAQIANPCHG